MALLSQRKYAEHRKDLGLRGTSHTAVQKAIKTGRLIEALVSGKIDPEIADREWSEHTDESLQRASAIDEVAVLQKAERVPRGKGGGNGKDARGSSSALFQEARADREAARAKLAELDLDERLGILVRTDEVKRAAFNAGRHARDVLVAMPARIAAAVHAAGSIKEVEQILVDEVESLCRELSASGDAERS